MNLEEKEYHHDMNEQNQLFIEYQINKNVRNLCQTNQPTEILQMLQYIIDFYIKEDEQIHLNNETMLKLYDSLLNLTKLDHRPSILSFHKKPTNLAIVAFILFSNFLQKVPEFFIIASNKPTTQLYNDLNIQYHLQFEVSIKQKDAAKLIISLLTLKEKDQPLIHTTTTGTTLLSNLPSLEMKMKRNIDNH
ncbi:unnamed protein product [Cunninghamella echinulata]